MAFVPGNFPTSSQNVSFSSRKTHALFGVYTDTYDDDDDGAVGPIALQGLFLAALLSTSLTRKAAAAVSVGTYSAWKVQLRCVCSAAREALGRPQGRRGACRHAHSLFCNNRCWSLVSVTSLLTLSVIATVKYSLTPLATWPPVTVESAVPALRAVSRGRAHFIWVGEVVVTVTELFFFILNSRAFDHP